MICYLLARLRVVACFICDLLLGCLCLIDFTCLWWVLRIARLLDFDFGLLFYRWVLVCFVGFDWFVLLACYVLIVVYIFVCGFALEF